MEKKMKKDLPTFSFYNSPYYEDQQIFQDNVDGLSKFSETASEEDLKDVLKSVAKEAKEAHKYEDGDSYWDIYNLNWTLIEIIDKRPNVAGNILDIIDGYYKASTYIDDHSRWTIEAIGCLGEKELAERAARLLGRFDYKDDSEHREACGIPTVRISPIDNILNVYNGDFLFRRTLKTKYTQGLIKDKLEASRSGKLREKRRVTNSITDPLAWKKLSIDNQKPLFEDYNNGLINPYDGELGDIGKTGNSKTGEVSEAQKARAEWVIREAKYIMKEHSWGAIIKAKLDLSGNQENGSNDYLATKQEIISSGLKKRRLSEKDIGKTGNSSTGEITEKDKRVAKSQIKDAKYTMLQRRKLQSRE